ncbi:MAG: 50S ribosomal protein L11 methyltransferase [Nitrospirae bacterium]|nr:50S ribosomal protein L11 methyltransferase [Nitrospirota bacterium]
MQYYEFTVIAPDESREAVMNKLNDMGCLGFIENDGQITAYFEWQKDIALLCDELSRFKLVLEASGLGSALSFRHVLLPDKDWNAEWKKNITPILAGENITIIPPWEKEHAGRINILIDSGMAFGTGHHETTRTCLAHIERISKEGGRKSLLDIGTGTGILAIGASMLGFTHIVGVDNDPLAVDAARRNVELNNLKNVEIKEGSISSVQGTFDGIIANLIAKTLIEIAHEVASMLNRGGIAVFSGMIAGDEENVLKAAESAGLVLEEKMFDDKWVTLIFQQT